MMVPMMAPHGATETELVALLRAGHASAFATVMRRNNQRLYRLARGVLRDEGEAEEVLQESYLRAFTHLDGFKGDSTITTWLSRIVLNEALGRLRRRRPTVAIDEVADTLAAAAPGALSREEPSPEQAIARQEIRRSIERAVDDLPASFRAVFMMRAIEQMSIEETASCLGIPPETVKTRFHRANKLLREALSARFGTILDGAFPFLGARCDRIIAAVLARLGLPLPSDLPAPSFDRRAVPRSLS
jgi:RNA polymerase sigma-70 factor, ECF subfamily